MIRTRFFAALLLSTVSAAPALAGPQQLAGISLRPFALPSFAEIRNALQHTPHHARRDTAQYTVIDVPGASQGYGQGTFAFALNSAGAVTGWYEDWLGKGHGFIRAEDGTYKTVDVGKALTVANGINDKGAVTGNYVDPKTDHCPGFLLTSKGKIKKFNLPDAEAGCGEYAGDINSHTAIVGDYYGLDGLIHGFLRTKDGTVTEFDGPGAIDTWAWYVNSGDVIAGPYSDSDGEHGYIRAADGSFTTFNAPGGPGHGNIASSINDQGETEGDYADDNDVIHGLLREPDGTLVTYDAPDAGTGAGQGTGGNKISNTGTASGDYLDSNNVTHGYIRTSDGTLTEIDPPGSIWTAVWDINDKDVTTGFYMDKYAVFHGFLRTP